LVRVEDERTFHPQHQEGLKKKKRGIPKPNGAALGRKRLLTGVVVRACKNPWKEENWRTGSVETETSERSRVTPSADCGECRGEKGGPFEGYEKV